MNRVYRLVFNHSLGLIQTAPETARSKGKGSITQVSSSSTLARRQPRLSFKRNALSAAIVLALSSFAMQAMAAPVGGNASGSTPGAGAGGGGDGGAGVAGAGAGGGGGVDAGGNGGFSGGSGGVIATTLIGNYTNSGTINGGNGGNAGYFSSGGGGGAAGVNVSTFMFTQSGTVNGGRGGQGGTGVTSGAKYSNGGAGGSGGGGGVGVYGASGSNIINSANINGGTGGTGGTGGNGGGGAKYSGAGGSGGAGGAGGAGVSGTGFTLNNSGSIVGGAGGVGGVGGVGGFTFFGTGGNGGNGGNGGAGGAGVSGTGFTLSNSGSIVGGDGGSGGSGGSGGIGGSVGSVGAGGVGGIGVSSMGNSTIINSGTISGGFDSTGFIRADAINLSGGGNLLVLQAGSIANGNVVSTSTTTADIVQIGAGDSTINGNFTLTSADILRIDVTNDTTYGKLTVNGTANLPANAKIDVNVANPNFSFAATKLTNILKATTLNAGGGFSVTDNSALFDFGAEIDGIDPNAIDLTLTRAALTVSQSVIDSNNPSALGAAKVLDGIIDGTIPSTGFQPVIDALGRLPTGKDVSDAASQTTPNDNSIEALQDSLNILQRIIHSRQDDNRGLSSGEGFLGDRYVWLKPFGSWANQDDRKGVSGYDAHMTGIILGADGEINDNNRIGFAASYSYIKVDGNSSTSPRNAKLDNYQMTVYGSHTLDLANYYIDYQVDAGRHNISGSRNILFNGTVAHSDYDGWSAHMGAGLGHIMPLSEKTIFTPSVRADYTYIRNDAYTEKDAGVLNNSVKSNSANELIVGIDGKLSHQLTDQVALLANLGTGYDVINHHNSVTSSFAGAPNASFTTPGIDRSPWLVRGGLGISSTIANGIEISARYDFEVRNSFDNQTASLKVKMPF